MENALLFAVLGFLFGKINIEISKKFLILHPKGTYSSSIYLRTSSADLNAPLPDVYIVAGKLEVEGPGP